MEKAEVVVGRMLTFTEDERNRMEEILWTAHRLVTLGQGGIVPCITSLNKIVAGAIARSHANLGTGRVSDH